jgi:hypothetical protein
VQNRVKFPLFFPFAMRDNRAVNRRRSFSHI